MLSGFATPEGTAKFAKASGAVSKNFRIVQDLMLSNVGVGTYLGEPDSETDELVKNAVKKSINSGINIIDTAINYRAQKAERSVGKAISELFDENKINRDEIFISTKNGYVTNDADIKQDFWQYVNQEYVKKGVIKAGDISSGYHCMTISYLEDQLNRSLNNLDLECVDLIYLHNAVEGQIQDLSKEQLVQKLKDVFEFYEKKRNDGKIKFYGMATWECFRVDSDNPQFLSLSDVLDLAKQVGSENHGFRFIQLPFNMNLDQAFMKKNQNVDGKNISILEAAQKYNIGVFTSVPFMQGRLLAPGAMPEFNELKPSLRALQFIRSTPGVLAPLVGHKLEAHVNENLEIMKIPPIEANEFSSLVKKLTS
ncbi:MAG: Oxidoreductase, aldo/keto reductase family protein [Nitrosopumilales archaeon]|nr:MAG: Oxidoreductase, aldo/keto reductase family protein [Nitrosopumilales archaeon]